MPPGKRGKYLGFVAHEIKNPLANALWSCDLLKRMSPADRAGERAEKMIDVALRGLRRMGRLIEDHFTIERLLEGGYELARERLSLRGMVAHALGVLATKEGVPTDGWIVELGAEEVQGDQEMLQRAVHAAIEYMARASPDPRLSISAQGQTLLVHAEKPPAPLEPPDPEERPPGDATGSVLGFALAARILEAHGGRLEARDGALALVFGP